MDTWTIIIFAAVIAAVGYFAWASHAMGRTKALAQLTELTEAVNVFVRAADGFYQKTDAEKYAYVFDESKKFLAARNISIPDDILRQLIEGAVELIHRAQAPKRYAPD